jgi:predicted dinucleotide-binding enzyme
VVKVFADLPQRPWPARRSSTPVTTALSVTGTFPSSTAAPAKATVTEFIESIGYSVVDAAPLADSWRQATGTPVWGTPYGPHLNEKGQPAGEDVIRAALGIAAR